MKLTPTQPVIVVTGETSAVTVDTADTRGEWRYNGSEEIKTQLSLFSVKVSSAHSFSESETKVSSVYARTTVSGL